MWDSLSMENERCGRRFSLESAESEENVKWFLLTEGKSAH